MKTNNPKTINEHFDTKYGQKGTESRAEFEKKAKSYLISEKRENYDLKFVKKILNAHKNDKRHTIPKDNFWDNI